MGKTNIRLIINLILRLVQSLFFSDKDLTWHEQLRVKKLINHLSLWWTVGASINYILPVDSWQDFLNEQQEAIVLLMQNI